MSKFNKIAIVTNFILETVCVCCFFSIVVPHDINITKHDKDLTIK